MATLLRLRGAAGLQLARRGRRSERSCAPPHPTPESLLLPAGPHPHTRQRSGHVRLKKQPSRRQLNWALPGDDSPDAPRPISRCAASERQKSAYLQLRRPPSGRDIPPGDLAAGRPARVRRGGHTGGPGAVQPFSSRPSGPRNAPDRAPGDRPANKAGEADEGPAAPFPRAPQAHPSRPGHRDDLPSFCNPHSCHGRLIPQPKAPGWGRRQSSRCLGPSLSSTPFVSFPSLRGARGPEGGPPRSSGQKGPPVTAGIAERPGPGSGRKVQVPPSLPGGSPRPDSCAPTPPGHSPRVHGQTFLSARPNGKPPGAGKGDPVREGQQQQPESPGAPASSQRAFSAEEGVLEAPRSLPPDPSRPALGVACSELPNPELPGTSEEAPGACSSAFCRLLLGAGVARVTPVLHNPNVDVELVIFGTSMSPDVSAHLQDVVVGL
uniref:basic salivary proline-rich protein 3-like n=1 Tax=Euleptes europaea TaxID=460621 RepID=UPI0025405E5C|nr:basic salivary proline-rich protein 3-like [Euleptes europaea]